MKRVSILLCSLVLVCSLLGVAQASTIDFTASPKDSSVTLSNISTFGWTSLTAALALDPLTFSVEDGSTETIDFFTLTATGFGVGSADISATLAFSDPVVEASGEGNTGWGTFFGFISGGYLYWDDSTLPDIFTLDGDEIMIDFEDGIAIVCGDTVTVHATITNNGAAPVPEPGTFLLLGVGLVSLVGYRRYSKK